MFRIHYNNIGIGKPICNTSNYWLKSELDTFGNCMLLHTTSDKKEVNCKKCLKILRKEQHING